MLVIGCRKWYEILQHSRLIGHDRRTKVSKAITIVRPYWATIWLIIGSDVDNRRLPIVAVVALDIDDWRVGWRVDNLSRNWHVDYFYSVIPVRQLDTGLEGRCIANWVGNK
jgi:hypothetical protein